MVETTHYDTENFEENIKFRKDLTENQKDIVITALNQFFEDEGKWVSFKTMEANGEEYNVLVTDHACRHCDVLDVHVTMGVWDNTVATLTLQPPAKTPSEKERD